MCKLVSDGVVSGSNLLQTFLTACYKRTLVSCFLVSLQRDLCYNSLLGTIDTLIKTPRLKCQVCEGHDRSRKNLPGSGKCQDKNIAKPVFLFSTWKLTRNILNNFPLIYLLLFCFCFFFVFFHLGSMRVFTQKIPKDVICNIHNM